MDVRSNFAPSRHIDPNEPGLVAAYCFPDNEMAVHGRWLNHAATGAVYDLTTRVGTPLVGQGGGILVTDDPNSYHSRAAQIGVTATASAYSSEIEVDANPTALRYVLINGSVAGYETRVEATGEIAISFDRATLSTTAAGFAPGKGPMRVTGIYDDDTGEQSLMINGTVYDTDAVVPAAPNGFFAIGQHGTTRAARVYRAARTAAEERAAYVKDFARRIVWQWKPRDVGEGPVGGILTGSCSGVGGWTCPLGAATMQFVWRPDLSIPEGGRLTLTDTQVAAMNRIDFELGPHACFGTWDIHYDVRDPATDSMIVGLTPRRGVDPTLAGSGAFWFWMRQVAGPWWRASVYYANGAQIDAVDTAALPVAGDRGILRITHAVNGDWQCYNYLRSTGGWWWSAAVGNDVSALNEPCLTVSPRGAYISKIVHYQGEMTPHEGEVEVPK